MVKILIYRICKNNIISFNPALIVRGQNLQIVTVAMEHVRINAGNSRGAPPSIANCAVARGQSLALMESQEIVRNATASLVFHVLYVVRAVSRPVVFAGAVAG